MKLIRIHEKDNVAVALADISNGEVVNCGDCEITAVKAIARGHKIALNKIASGENIIKYGFPIGVATEEIEAGSHVHVHNMKTSLSEQASYSYNPDFLPLQVHDAATFQGYLRADGRAAVRNELWIIPTVGCVNSVAQKLAADNQHLVSGSIDGLYAFPHPYGCSQMGDDHEQTKKLLAALADHPNAGGVLILGLGCENNTMDQFKEALGTWDPERVKFLVSQESADEFAESSQLLAQLARYAAGYQRQTISADKLIIGMKCGGSDGLSGITANPTVGRFSDLLIAQGGTTILTEVPEMFGAEGMLMNRCVSEAVYNKTVNMVEGFKKYFISHGQVVYENPSPGNKDGGISTLEDKSCGCVQKGGTAPIVDVVDYGARVAKLGLNLLSGPGNDLVSATALTAAGAHIVLFTTGRGTPFGAPAPTVKISSNTALYEHKPNWIDFNAGTVAEGESLDDAGQRLLDYVLKVASGEQVLNETNGYREIAIFKDGVTL